MRRKKKNANKSLNLQVLPLVHPNAAGIDVGAKEHVVAVPGDRDPKPVRTFQTFTPDLHQLAAWPGAFRHQLDWHAYRFAAQ